MSLRAAARKCGGFLSALIAATSAHPAADGNHSYCTAPAYQAKVLRDVADIKQLSTFGASGTILALKRDGSIVSPDPAAPSGNDIAFVAQGHYHGAAITKDRTVLVWGNAAAGEYGLGAYTDIVEGEIEENVYRVPPLTDVKAIAAGETHTLALLQDGSVWAWGGNDWGQLGSWAGTRGESEPAAKAGTVPYGEYGRFEHASRPRPVTGLANVIAIAAGARHSVALKKDGTVWFWGNDSYTYSDGRRVPLIDHYRFARSMASFNPVAKQVPGLSRIVAIAAGYHYTLAVKADGTLWAWGMNDCGQIGRPRVFHDERLADRLFLVGREYEGTPAQVAGLSGVKAVAAGVSHSVALTKDGRVWAWGGVKFGRIGVPQREAGTPAEGLCKGTISEPFYSDHPYSSVPAPVAGLADVIDVGAGEGHSMALHRNGTVSVWGQCAGCPGILRASYEQDKPCPFVQGPRKFRPPDKKRPR